jgi:hypothetical protein
MQLSCKQELVKEWYNSELLLMAVRLAARSLQQWNGGFESNSGQGGMSAFLLCLCCSV